MPNWTNIGICSVVLLGFFMCCRVCLPPEPFLIIFFSSLHSKPEFYECVTTNGRRSLEFELSSCHDIIQTKRVCLFDVHLLFCCPVFLILNLLHSIAFEPETNLPGVIVCSIESITWFHEF